MKAWIAMNYTAECGYIVFAATRGKARAAAIGCAGMEGAKWKDVQVGRLHYLDGKKDRECVLSWEKDTRIYYEAGWWPVDGAPSCDCCGLYEYEEFPESRVTETDDGALCAACMADDEAPRQ